MTNLIKQISEASQAKEIFNTVVYSSACSISYGSIAIIKQDNSIIQINISETAFLYKQGKSLNHTEEEYMTSHNSFNENRTIISEEDLKKLLQYIESIRYGSVTLLIQDGRIAQIEKNEKIKLK
jgi:hypothetical protein